MEPAFETIGDPNAACPLVLTCEHASNRLPEWQAEAGDEPLLEDHWGYDIGAADVTRALARALGAAAVLSDFSRLVCDPNRDPQDPTFVVEQIDEHVVSWNRGLDATERARRARTYYAPYHDAIDELITHRRAAGRPTRLCSIHSFAPLYREARREMEIGVLFDAYEDVAHTMVERLRRADFVTEPNRPYSGYEGLIHAARRHGRAQGIVYLELEIRQDLIASSERAEAIASRIAPVLRAFATEAGSAEIAPA